jgi:hypothetical protein
MKTVLITLGRLPKALELARSLAGAGCRVIVAEPFRWHICRLSRAVHRSYTVTAPNTDLEQYRAQLSEIIQREGVDLVVPVSEESIHALSVQPMVGPQVEFFSPPVETVMALHDKLSFAQIAAGFGLRIPATFALSDPGALRIASAGPFVVKPTHSCSGIGLQVRPARAELPSPAVDGEHLVQAFIEGQHVSTFSIAHNGVVSATVIYRGTVLTGTVAVCFERIPQFPAVTRWVEQFVASSGYSGFISFDFIVNDDAVWAIECNPRITSGVHFVDPSFLAAAVLDPGTTIEPVYRQQMRFQQLYTTLTATYASIFDGPRFRAHFRNMLAARDVVWALRDPLPFLLMTPACYQILFATIFQGISFGEASTRDIGWFGDTGPPARIHNSAANGVAGPGP